MTIRAKLYMIKDDLSLSMIDFNNFIKDKYPICDCDNITKKYIYISTDNYDINECICKYIISKIDDNDNIKNIFKKEQDNIYDIIIDNLDVFVDIIEKEDNIIIVELSE